MQKPTINFNTRILSLLMLLSLLSLYCANAQSSDYDFNACEYTGTVFHAQSDVGAFQILLDDGRWIIPVAASIPDFFSDSLRVKVGFEFLGDSISPCLSCNYVYLTCAMLLPDPADCKARIEAYPLEIDDHSADIALWYIYEFVDISIGNVIDRAWFINGDSIYADESFTYTFKTPGIYTVCLVIETETGCWDKYCMDLNVGVSNNCHADFGYYPIDDILYPATDDNFIVIGYPYQFYDKSYGNVTEWYWMFEDIIITGDSVPVYTFAAPGTYNVCLSIKTVDGCESTLCKTVVVGEPEDCKAMFEYYNPLDAFPTEPYDFPGSRVIQFVDVSRGDITHWYWDFGDGTTSNEQNPVHEFPHAGEFEVCLKVASGDGCEDKYCAVVYVEPGYNCHAYFEYCSYTINSPDGIIPEDALIIGFLNYSIPNGVYSKWEFGDGCTSTEHNPIHIYRHPGIYNVCLSIYSSDNCYDHYCTSVYVGIEECKVDFTHEIIAPDCWGFEIAHYFSAITTQETWSYNWDLGDGHTASGAQVAHYYEKEGFYNVCLEVTYANGCVAKKCMLIYNSSSVNDSVFFEKCNPSGIELPREGSSLTVTNVYPVPASDLLTIDLYSNATDDIDISLVNTLGQTKTILDDYTISSGNNQLELRLDDLEPGTYIYLISSPEALIRGRVSIIK